MQGQITSARPGDWCARSSRLGQPVVILSEGTLGTLASVGTLGTLGTLGTNSATFSGMLILNKLLSTVFFLTAVAVAESPAGDPSADDTGAPESGEAAAEAVVLPQPLADGAVDFSPLTTDPGFETWFDGVIRVERGGEVLFSVAPVRMPPARPSTGLHLLAGLDLQDDLQCCRASPVDEGLLGLDDPIGMHLRAGCPPMPASTARCAPSPGSSLTSVAFHGSRRQPRCSRSKIR